MTDHASAREEANRLLTATEWFTPHFDEASFQKYLREDAGWPKDVAELWAKAPRLLRALLGESSPQEQETKGDPSRMDSSTQLVKQRATASENEADRPEHLVLEISVDDGGSVSIWVPEFRCFGVGDTPSEALSECVQSMLEVGATYVEDDDNTLTPDGLALKRRFIARAGLFAALESAMKRDAVARSAASELGPSTRVGGSSPSSISDALTSVQTPQDQETED